MQTNKTKTKHPKQLGPVVLDISAKELKADEKEILAHPQVGGLILFTRNFESSDQLRDLVRSVREARPNIVICVDHEGGRVQRFKRDFTLLPAMQKLGLEYQRAPDDALAAAEDLGWLMAAELVAHDIDLSFAPVLDVDDCLSDIIGDRAFSSNPEQVSLLAGHFIQGMRQAGMKATGKHFPGHGSVKADSHLELPVNPLSMSEMEARDLLPFRRLVAELDALMSAHIVFPNIEPALVSYSAFWLKDFLREQMDFKGLVFSDDLSMAGAAGAGSYGDRARLALQAGCDALIVCNHPAGAIEILETLESKANPVPEINLQRLRHHGRASWPLNNHPRWQKAQEIIHNLN